ncbi:MAG TPA: MBL fold metallo-hydrolase [Vicinamibacterales bacterium]|nr:MBL fold metallo-hydrolase [Vicinamibacterales bacterium]
MLRPEWEGRTPTLPDVAARSAEAPPLVYRVDHTPLLRRTKGQTVLAFVNHATFVIQTDAGNIVTDPVWADPFTSFQWTWSKRYRRRPIAFDALPPIRQVLISHDDRDHLDIPTLVALSKCHDPIFVTGMRTGRLLRTRGIERVVELDWWQAFNDGGLCITMTPAQHGSGHHRLNRNRTLWGGFVIETLTTRVFFAGDTGYTAHFRGIRRRCGSIDVALLPIDYCPPTRQTEGDHLTPDDAVNAHRPRSATKPRDKMWRLPFQVVSPPECSKRHWRVAIYRRSNSRFHASVNRSG